MTTTRHFTRTGIAAALLLAAVARQQAALGATNFTVLGWNNLGMHCMDSDYSVFSILPPYNTFHAQVVMTVNGSQARLMTGAVLSASYRAVADPDGSINSTAIGKTGFWDYAQKLFGVALPPDKGLPVPGPEGWMMPGVSNVPQAMAFETAQNWFAAYGVPVTPYDDNGRPNQYPLVRIVVGNGVSTQAYTDIVVPVSDEMDCRLCHLSGSGDAAKPAAGWVNEPLPGRDYRLNILRLHDERQAGKPLYAAALAAKGFHAAGLLPTVTQNQTPILCAACHLSEALPGSGFVGIAPLTRAMHSRHANVVDPRNGQVLDAVANRVSCYTCHPGSATRCLRGAMGGAVAPDGSMAMQCQNCHGGMSAVGAATRTGWLDEPNCQSCHVGSATNRYGTIRYLSALTTGGTLRAAAEPVFATNPDTPAPGTSLYRFSTGHGGLQCAACHGSTHAEFPAGRNDNLQNVRLQGHAGVIGECSLCHGTQPNTITGGPHGMHPVGQAWVSRHPDLLESGQASRTQCRACHGADYRGTVLSRMQADRTLSAFGTKTFYRGMIVGCYNCHRGPSSGDANANAAPVVAGAAVNTEAGVPVVIPLSATDANGNALTLRIISQATRGTVALAGTIATYHPEAGFAGNDAFTFAANDGSTDSNLGTITIAVSSPDADGDGIPDWWTRQYFGHPEGRADDVSRAGDDADADDMSNVVEYRAGTDPLDGRSTLRFAVIRGRGAPGQLEIPTALGQRFRIEASDRLGAGATWTPVLTNIFGHQDSVTVNLTNQAPSVRFYRMAAP